MMKNNLLTRAAIALYPAAWRARYADEVIDLLAESGTGKHAVASLIANAPAAWLLPARHLYDRPARMRASLATVAMAWTALVGLALVFAQLTQAQGISPPGSGRAMYVLFDVAFAASVLIVGAGGLPLWLVMARRARRDRSVRDLAYLSTPVVVPLCYLLAVIVLAAVVRGPDGIAAWWFGAVVGAGFVAGGLAAAGPVRVLHKMRPRGPAVRLAALAAGAATATMVTATAASAVVAIWMYAPQHSIRPGYTALLGVYLLLSLAAAATAVTSSARGVKAARSVA